VPSSTKLTDRLTDTIERPESTETPNKSAPTSTNTPRPSATTHPRRPTTHFRPPRRGSGPWRT